MIRKDKVTAAELFVRIFGLIIFIFLVTCIIFPFAKGIPVLGLPKSEDIKSVEITDTRDGKKIVLSEKSDIDKISKASKFLLYKIKSSKISEDKEVLIIKYTDLDGIVTEISVSKEFLYYNGKVRQFKNRDIYFLAIEDMFLS